MADQAIDIDMLKELNPGDACPDRKRAVPIPLHAVQEHAAQRERLGYPARVRRGVASLTTAVARRAGRLKHRAQVIMVWKEALGSRRPRDGGFPFCVRIMAATKEFSKAAGGGGMPRLDVAWKDRLRTTN